MSASATGNSKSFFMVHLFAISGNGCYERSLRPDSEESNRKCKLERFKIARASRAWVATTSAVFVVGRDAEMRTRQKSIGLAWTGAITKIKTKKPKSNAQQGGRCKSDGEPPHSIGRFLFFVASRFFFRRHI